MNWTVAIPVGIICLLVGLLLGAHNAARQPEKERDAWRQNAKEWQIAYEAYKFSAEKAIHEYQVANDAWVKHCSESHK